MTRIVATIKAATIKNKHRKNDFRAAGQLSHFWYLRLHDGQLVLELHYTTAKTFLPLLTIGRKKIF